VSAANGMAREAVKAAWGIPPHEDITHYEGLELDEFQRKAIKALLEGKSVLVSAPTGAGKTLVADYLIEHLLRGGREHLLQRGSGDLVQGGTRAIYTAPIKALSNQKYKEFKARFGSENIGILTGDVVINEAAPILIMTTEILRNILHMEVERLDSVSHVIFDEIHYIGNEERGSVWEEAIIFLPRHIKILGLSATIPNASELAGWMSDVRGERVVVIRHHERPVPLVHYVFEKGMGAGSLQDLVKYHRKLQSRHRRKTWTEAHFTRGRGGEGWGCFPSTSHLDLVRYLTPNLLPCLYFLFSRQQCEAKAMELAQRQSFLSREERREVREFFDEKIRSLSIEGFPTTKALRQVLGRGIGFHHAGLLPVLKEVVEELFAGRKIAVLYCTETFAVGVNLPVRSVCFDSPEKFDGFGYRPMTHQEYFQMAGRAGRRGIDSQGYVFTLVDLNYFRREEFPLYEERKIEDLVSQFSLSYNTVLNLVSKYSEAEIRILLDKSFVAYQRRARARKAKDKRRGAMPATFQSDTAGDVAISGGHPVRDTLMESMDGVKGMGNTGGGEELLEEFWAKVRLLKRLGYINEHPHKALQDKVRPAAAPYATLTRKGEIASRINVQELLVTELISGGLFHELDEDQVNSLAVAIDYEPRREGIEVKKVPFDLDKVISIVERVRKAEARQLGSSTVVFDPYLSNLAYMWSKGMGFGELMHLAGSGLGMPGASRELVELVRRYLAGRWALSTRDLRDIFASVPPDEGDIVSGFRRAIDLLRQVRLACSDDSELVAKMNRCMDRMDRDVVQVNL